MKQIMIELYYEEVPAAVTTAAGKDHEAAGSSVTKKYKVTSKKEVKEVNEAKQYGAGQNDTLAFRSDLGDVTIKILEPADLFETNVFSTDRDYCARHNIPRGAPLVIKTREEFKFKYCCGFSVGFPNNEDIGNTDDTGPH